MIWTFLLSTSFCSENQNFPQHRLDAVEVMFRSSPNAEHRRHAAMLQQQRQAQYVERAREYTANAREYAEIYQQQAHYANLRLSNEFHVF